MRKIKVKFPKGVQRVHIPFLPELGSYDQLFREIERVEYPKKTRRIEASLVVSIDLAKGQTSYKIGEVVVSK